MKSAILNDIGINTLGFRPADENDWSSNNRHRHPYGWIKTGPRTVENMHNFYLQNKRSGDLRPGYKYGSSDLR